MIVLRSDHKALGIIVQSDLALSDKQAKDEGKELVVIDLHVGLAYRLAGRQDAFELKEPITLKPNDCIRIRTSEKFTVPGNVFGQVCSKASLSGEGIVVANLKVDPNFIDQYLFISVFNVGNRSIVLQPGEAFCSVFFQHLEKSLPPGSPPRVAADGRVKPMRKVRQFFLNNQKFIITGLVSFLASIGARAIFELWKATAGK